MSTSRGFRPLLSILSALAVAAFVWATPAAQGTQTPAATGLSQAESASKLPTDPEVTTGSFPNGLKYYIRKNLVPQNRAELRLVVNAGSLLEEDDQQGLAHFVEHMAFNGTKNFPKQEVVSFLESLGMRFGADINA